MLTISHRSGGSSQSVLGTLTNAGDSTKLHNISSPARIAAGGTLVAFAA